MEVSVRIRYSGPAALAGLVRAAEDSGYVVSVFARTAAAHQTVSGGRFRLGLGTSGPQVVEGWHGVRSRVDRYVADDLRPLRKAVG